MHCDFRSNHFPDKHTPDAQPTFYSYVNILPRSLVNCLFNKRNIFYLLLSNLSLINNRLIFASLDTFFHPILAVRPLRSLSVSLSISLPRVQTSVVAFYCQMSLVKEIHIANYNNWRKLFSVIFHFLQDIYLIVWIYISGFEYRFSFAVPTLLIGSHFILEAHNLDCNYCIFTAIPHAFCNPLLSPLPCLFVRSLYIGAKYIGMTRFLVAEFAMWGAQSNRGTK